MKKPIFKVGDKVTYKSKKDLPSKCYYYAGEDQAGFIGVVCGVYGFIDSADCYKIEVTTNGHGLYSMLESEFREYDKPVDSVIAISTASEKPKLSFNF